MKICRIYWICWMMSLLTTSGRIRAWPSKYMMKKLLVVLTLVLPIMLMACAGFGNAAFNAVESRMTSPTPPKATPSPITTPETKSPPNNSPIVPDSKLTPGDVLEVTKEDICTPGYSKKVRDVPQAVKEKAYAEYGITSRQPREYEVDHLISLELGGSNSIKNLWPESYLTEPWNARVKDTLENKLHKMICDGTIDIKVAQQAIASDWIGAYKKYVGELKSEKGTKVVTPDSKPDKTISTDKKDAKDANDSKDKPLSIGGTVIGNKNSKIYHRPDCPGYKTISEKNRVEFPSSADAEKAGYRIAKNCPGQ
jgi:Metal binding domain of Ada